MAWRASHRVLYFSLSFIIARGWFSSVFSSMTSTVPVCWFLTSIFKGTRPSSNHRKLVEQVVFRCDRSRLLCRSLYVSRSFLLRLHPVPFGLWPQPKFHKASCSSAAVVEPRLLHQTLLEVSGIGPVSLPSCLPLSLLGHHVGHKSSPRHTSISATSNSHHFLQLVPRGVPRKWHNWTKQCPKASCRWSTPGPEDWLSWSWGETGCGAKTHTIDRALNLSTYTSVVHISTV